MIDSIPSPTPSRFSFWGLSLLGYKVLDLVGALVAPRSVLVRLPILRFVLVSTILLAGYQALSSDASTGVQVDTSSFLAPTQPVFATAGLFGGHLPETVVARTSRQLEVITTQRKAVAQLSLKLAVDRPSLMAAVLLRSGELSANETLDVQAFATKLAMVAANTGAVTPGAWVRAAADLFADPVVAEATLHHYIRRYGLN